MSSLSAQPLRIIVVLTILAAVSAAFVGCSMGDSTGDRPDQPGTQGDSQTRLEALLIAADSTLFSDSVDVDSVVALVTEVAVRAHHDSSINDTLRALRLALQAYLDRESELASHRLDSADELLELVSEGGKSVKAWVLTERSVLHYRERRYDEAISGCQRALQLLANDETRHPHLAIYILNAMADASLPAGRSPLAAEAAERALQIATDAGLSEQRRLGAAYGVGERSMIVGRFARAEECLRLVIDAGVPGTVGARLSLHIQALNVLGRVYTLEGRLSEAKECLTEALAMVSHYPPGGTLNAMILKNIGNVYKAQGRYDEAEAKYKESYQVRLKDEGPNAPHLAEALTNLGDLYLLQGRYADAEAKFREALELREAYFGPFYPYLVYHLLGLGKVFAAQGRFAEAEESFKRSIRICDSTLSPTHLHLAWSLEGLADSYRCRGMYADAESKYLRALSIKKGSLGLRGSEAAGTLTRLAHLYGAWGEFDKCRQYLAEMLEQRQDFVEGVFGHASSDQKLRYLREYPLLHDPLFSLVLVDGSDESCRLALTMLLKGKGMALEAAAADKRIAATCQIDNIQALDSAMRGVVAEISNLEIVGPQGVDPTSFYERQKQLQGEMDSLETCLASLCEPFRREHGSRQFVLADVAAAVPASAVLWEFARFLPYDFTAHGSDDDRWRAPHYVAFALQHDGKVSIVDLGEAQLIDSLIMVARGLLYSSAERLYSRSGKEAKRDLDRVTGALYELIAAPLISMLDSLQEILIAPDGQLCLLPFEILPFDEGYLVERYSLSYLSSGRDLLRFGAPREPPRTAVIIGDPDFDARNRSQTVLDSACGDLGRPVFSALSRSRGGGECIDSAFSPLAKGGREAETVTRLLRAYSGIEVAEYRGEAACEEVLKGMSSAPGLLHIVTHGQFCADVDTEEGAISDNLLLRSVLAMSGANTLRWRADAGGGEVEDGILTAYEVSALNLVGTDLAVLSACETGVGGVRNGEGVFGLRRAFQHAGTRSLLMTLWRIPDDQTIEMITSFYEEWLGGASKKQALRQAVLGRIDALRSRFGVAHPYFWGGFVLVGDPN